MTLQIHKFVLSVPTLTAESLVSLQESGLKCDNIEDQDTRKPKLKESVSTSFVANKKSAPIEDRSHLGEPASEDINQTMLFNSGSCKL